MDLDRVRGEKHLEISALVGGGYSREAIEAELAKCDIVCAICHRMRTFERRHRQVASSIPSSLLGRTERAIARERISPRPRVEDDEG